MHGFQPNIFRGNSNIKDAAGEKFRQEFFSSESKALIKSTNFENFVAVSELLDCLLDLSSFISLPSKACREAGEDKRKSD